MLGPNLASWPENAVNLQLKLSNQTKKETKLKRRRNEEGDKIKMTKNLESIEKN